MTLRVTTIIHLTSVNWGKSMMIKPGGFLQARVGHEIGHFMSHFIGFNSVTWPFLIG